MHLKPVGALLAICVFTALSCNAVEEIVGPVLDTDNSEELSAIIPGRVNVELTEDMAAILENGGSLPWPGVVSAERIFPDAGEWEPRHRKEGLHRWYKVQYDSSLPPTKAVSEFLNMPGAVYVEPVRRKEIAGFFNDPRSSDQWALYNEGGKAQYTKGCDVNVYPVWERYGAGRSDVIVAVFDQGVQLDHPDLAAVCLPSGPRGSRSFIDGSFNVVPGNHGTHVAGVIAAINNNGEGISGIAGGNDGKGGVRIMSCEILRSVPKSGGKEGETTTIGGDDNAAYVWAADYGAVIAQNSWSIVYETEADAAKGGIGTLGVAIDYFIKYAGCDKDGNQRPDSPMKGGVVFFAAGNDSRQHSWPAMYEKVYAVGAVSSKRARAYYSNYGDWVDICAPGGDVNVGPQILSCIANGGYGYMQGTSMACPHVSGVAALIASCFGGPGFTNEMLVDKLLRGADYSGSLANSKIGPLVDAMGSFALDKTEPPLPVTGNVTVRINSNNATFTWAVTEDPDEVKAFAYMVLLSKDPADLATTDYGNLPESVIRKDVEVLRAGVGEQVLASFTDLEFETKYYVTIVAYDYRRHYSEPSVTGEFTTGPNQAPFITTSHTEPLIFKAHETAEVDYKIGDPDGHAFTVSFEPGSDAVTPVYNNNSVTLKFTARKAPTGKYAATLTVTDKFGLATTLAIPYEVLENHAPVVQGQIENVLFTKTGENITLSMYDYFQDEDGEDLKFTFATSPANVAHLSPNRDQVVLSAVAYGLTDVTITATDVREETCELVFKVLVQDKSRPVALYPNPVKSQLHIRPLESGKMDVSISNKAGATVFSGSSEVSPFSPYDIDLSGIAAGSYYVRLNGCGVDSVYTIAKI